MMKHLLPAAALALMTASANAQPTKFIIDPTHTFVIYEIGHFGTTTNRGRFSTKDGSVLIDRAAKTGQVDITMDITSINTGVDALNRHVQSKDFFNAAEFPTGRFVSDQVRFDGDKITEMSGKLTLLGQTHPITLTANRYNCYDNPLIKRQVCGGDFETTVLRSQWGITWGLGLGFEDKVRLLVQVEGINVQ